MQKKSKKHKKSKKRKKKHKNAKNAKQILVLEYLFLLLRIKNISPKYLGFSTCRELA